jgi:hypothetical protein
MIGQIRINPKRVQSPAAPRKKSAAPPRRRRQQDHAKIFGFIICLRKRCLMLTILRPPIQGTRTARIRISAYIDP